MALKQQRSMDLTAVRCLINSVSRFIHLVRCSPTKDMPTQKDYTHLSSLLKQLKPLLDDIVDGKVPSDEILCKDCEELDIAVNEAREFFEKWSPKMSKILCVVQSELLLKHVQNSLLKISQILFRSLESSSSLILSDIKDFQHLQLEKLSHCIEEALGRQREGKVPSSEHLIPISESLNLTSNEVLLNESIALEKERIKAEENKMKKSLEEVNLIILLLSHIRDRMVKMENFKSINGIKIPPYFLCPLSLDLMVDPVIVASGQTYEKSSIQKWLDQGLSMCPKTCQKLSHNNLIPNYTVKALTANWCQENGIKLPCPDGALIENDHSQNGHSSLGSSTGVANDSGKKISCSLGLSGEESDDQSRDAEKSDNSPTHSYVHSRSESTSSAVSSVDYLPAVSSDISRFSGNHDCMGDIPREMGCSPVISTESNACPHLTGRQYLGSNVISGVTVNGNHSPPGSVSFSSDPQFDNLTTTCHVEKLLSDLKTEMAELQSAAAAELRFLAKHNNDNRVIIGNCGAIGPLISLLLSDVKPIQEHAVTALLNLSINENLKAKIAEGGALEPLIHVLRTGNNVAKENAAACLFSLSVLEDYKAKIGRSAAVKGLVDLLGTGTIRGKKDAATALFNLSIFHENKARIVQAGAVKYLVELLDPEREMVDKAVALLANLSTITEGCSAIAREGGIPMLVELVEIGSQRGKENSASILLQLCINSPKYCRLVLQEGAVPPLVALSQSGTPRAKEKAQQLLSHFRSQREGAMGRGKP